ncbi:hypothetical protein MLD38_012945 [Melastoma candidum]|uniref:Uncharacterized protein n=1 Tax=Melastoma candidum TaxID=119954 RepID=A0ACB9R7L3_9MYRT|nr:hypothetical protein MLD38_012945 [Melastoma candidum]
MSDRRAVIQAAFWYGLIVHFRIYPIIYALPIILLLDPRLCQLGQKQIVKVWSPSQSQSIQTDRVVAKLNALGELKGLFSKERNAFGVISTLVFLSLTGFSFYLYEWEFLHEALLYHLGRTDPRHNFSIYFYHIFFIWTGSSPWWKSSYPSCLSLWCNWLLFSALHGTCHSAFFFKQLHSWPLQGHHNTVLCVVLLLAAFNSVVGQHASKMEWLGLHGVMDRSSDPLAFLGFYLLEFKGKNVFLQLWIAGIVFLAATTFVLVMIISRHVVYSPLFQPLAWASSKNKGKCE